MAMGLGVEGLQVCVWRGGAVGLCSAGLCSALWRGKGQQLLPGFAWLGMGGGGGAGGQPGHCTSGELRSSSTRASAALRSGN